jgi:3-hydroxy acid dehydrogenase/malonic semialdehyde reductase
MQMLIIIQTTVINTNVLGAMYVAHAVLNAGMMKAGRGDIVNVSSITGLRAPPMGECSYHTSKTAMEGFSNTLRHELIGTNIRVLVVRPGFVGGDSLFHFTRHGEGDTQGGQGNAVFEGLEPLLPGDVAEAVWAQVNLPERVSLTAVDVVPTAQRSLYVADRDWNKRNGVQ